MEFILFLPLAGICIITAILVIFQRNVLYSALYLIVNLLSLAGIYYFVLSAPFIAGIQVIVYAGGIMMLFLFVIMMVNIKEKEEDKISFQKYFAFILGTIFLGETLYLVRGSLLTGKISNLPENVLSSPYMWGSILYTKYFLGFEIASVILLLGIIGAIVLAKKR